MLIPSPLLNLHSATYRIKPMLHLLLLHQYSRTMISYSRDGNFFLIFHSVVYDACHFGSNGRPDKLFVDLTHL